MRLVFGGSKWLGGPLLWLAMLAAAGICAAGSYEHVVIVPRWIEAPPSSLAMFHGEYAIDTGRFWRVVHAPALLLCVGAFLALRRHPRRAYIGAALLGYLALLGATAGWILPELLAITGDPTAPLAPAEWRTRAQRWESLSLVRLGSMYVITGLLVWAASGGGTGARASRGDHLE